MSSKLIVEYPLRRRILLSVVGPRVKELSRWKQKLQLLHVCKLWADMVTPVVFREIIFYGNAIIEQSETSLGAIARQVFYSNLSVIIAREAHNYSDSFYIGSRYDLFLHHAILEISIVLGQFQFDFPNVHTLVIDFKVKNPYLRNILNYKRISDYSIESAKNIFYTRFPNIKCLSGNNSNYFGYELASFKHYFSELSLLIYSEMANLNNINHFHSSLAYLYLDLGRTDFSDDKLPALNALPLKFLVLRNIDLEGFHKFFKKNSDIKCISFPHLELLGLEFLAPTREFELDIILNTVENNPSDFKLHLPSLKYLLLANCKYDYFLINLLPYCKDMKMIYIRGFYDIIANAKNLAMQNAKNLIIHLPSDYDISGDSLTNFFNIISSAKTNTQLYVDYYFSRYLDLFFFNTAFEWSFLKHLSFDCTIYIRDVIYFIWKLPNLQTLWANHTKANNYLSSDINLEGIKNLTIEFAELAYNSDINIRLESSNLKHLHLLLPDYCPQIYVGLLVFITKHVPSIESYNINEEEYKLISKNMDVYKKIYPHLQDVTLGIFDDGLPYRNISTLQIDDDGFINFPDF